MQSRKKLPKTPSGEQVRPELYDPQLRWAMRRSRWFNRVRDGVSAYTVRPFEDWLFRQWLTQGSLASRVEALGLPRRSVEVHLGNNLDIVVDPAKLVCSMSLKRSFTDSRKRRTASNRFIWPGDWDLTRFDFQTSQRYRFISDIWQHRRDLDQSCAYQDFLEQLNAGKPFRSPHRGVLLNTSLRVWHYLKLYIGYMEAMALGGFDDSLGKDRLGVAIDRHGQLIKINKGLHRLAMAQVVGLETIVVRVRAVHEDWWREVTQGAQGEEALRRLVDALSECEPAQAA
ncbi:hypothetical protein SAMN05443545_10923 [Aidingimonas halophila]|uniref:Uncharacterized protein n=2 Tax=Aidingimonas halophila TaxID=574349 RepID=A0A1H3G677_9GAMM|nr:hypothetical protein SAMN05443545_10923 [Aidingimonas halophila]